MEKVVQRTLCKESQKIDKEAVIKCSVEDTEVASGWCSLGVDGDSGIALLDTIIKLRITIRGFSYASAFVELYKQKTKKTLQRAKALRKVV